MEYYDVNFIISTGLDKTRMDSVLAWLDSKFNVAAESADRKIQRKKLAYAIKKETEGWHYQLRFVAPADISPKFFEGLQKEIKSKKEILRFLIVKKRDEPPAKERRAPRAVEAVAAENSETAAPSQEAETKNETEIKVDPSEVKKTEKKEKVQLQEIDEKLEEILKEE
jgi:ribosomal protein S6